ncbi:hypothetical protein H097_23464 [Pseudomonas sp. FH4]|uniref:hypothetical protein n=1 Tax=Pseudomonas sp. FH4 TaxID=1284393 RepID=UPI0003DD5858|nr:hypothetical protein [Pseudomonas sp. FH4]ETK15433.1 hypothetical protein H097_23464 [Pseudomonas sp. FH4]
MVKKTTPKHSQSVTTQPLAEIAVELPYPQILYAANNSILYPIDAETGTVATIKFTGMGTTPITLYWAIKDQEEPAFEPIVQSGNPSGSIDIPILWQTISTCIGHTVLIWYTAMVGGQLKQSLVLELEIQDIRETDLRESLPVFAHARLEWNTLWLNMYEFQGDEIIRIKAWPMIQAGQRLFVTVAGDQHQVPYAFTWVAFDHVVQAEEANPEHVFEFRLARGWLASRQDYSALTTHMGVIWDGSAPVLPNPDDLVHENPLPLNAQDFHLRTTTLLRVDPALELPPPHLKESVDCGTDGWLVNPLNTVDGAHIVIAYEGMHAGDIVCPSFTGTAGAGSPALECRTVQEGESSLVFLVPPSPISANFGLPITLEYQVYYNGTGPWPSPARVVKVLDLSGLPTPAVEQATGSTLDLNTFAGDATATESAWPYIALDQACWLWVTGVLESGSAYSFEVLEGEPVTEEWLASGVNTPLPRDELQKLADCRDVEVHFAVNFNGQSDKASAKAFPPLVLHVVQEDLDLDAPTVREAVGEQLTIWNGRDGVTVRVEYERISPDHTINVQWLRQDGASLPLEPKTGNSDPGYVDFAIPREAVIYGAGKTVLIHYTVTSACKLASSRTLPLQISVPVRLPTPVVPQATLDILDLNTFEGNADVEVFDETFSMAYWFALENQKVWLDAEGVDESGAPHRFTVFSARNLTANEVEAGVDSVLLRTELEKLKNGSLLALKCYVAADGRPSKQEAIAFPVRSLTVVVPTKVRYEDFTGQAQRFISAGQSISVPSMKISFVSGPEQAGIHSYTLLPFTSGPAIVMAYQRDNLPQHQVLRLDLEFTCKKVQFGVSALNLDFFAFFFNKSGVKLGEVVLRFADGGKNQWVDFTPSAGNEVARIDISASDWLYVDNFTFWL